MQQPEDSSFFSLAQPQAPTAVFLDEEQRSVSPLFSCRSSSPHSSVVETSASGCGWGSTGGGGGGPGRGALMAVDISGGGREGDTAEAAAAATAADPHLAGSSVDALLTATATDVFGHHTAATTSTTAILHHRHPFQQRSCRRVNVEVAQAIAADPIPQELRDRLQQNVLQPLTPTTADLTARNTAIFHVCRCFVDALRSGGFLDVVISCFVFGSVHLRTVLPDGDNDICVVVDVQQPQQASSSTAPPNTFGESILTSAPPASLSCSMESTAIRSGGGDRTTASPHPPFSSSATTTPTSMGLISQDTYLMRARDYFAANPSLGVYVVNFIYAEVRVLKLVTCSLSIDLTIGQTGGVKTACFLHAVDRRLNGGHIFKRTLLLLKAWGNYEGRVVGGQGGYLGTYALTVMLLAVLNTLPTHILEHYSPLQLMVYFFLYYSLFRFDVYCVTLYGPLPLRLLQEGIDPNQIQRFVVRDGPLAPMFAAAATGGELSPNPASDEVLPGEDGASSSSSSSSIVSEEGEDRIEPSSASSSVPAETRRCSGGGHSNSSSSSSLMRRMKMMQEGGRVVVPPSATPPPPLVVGGPSSLSSSSSATSSSCRPPQHSKDNGLPQPLLRGERQTAIGVGGGGRQQQPLPQQPTATASSHSQEHQQPSPCCSSTSGIQQQQQRQQTQQLILSEEFVLEWRKRLNEGGPIVTTAAAVPNRIGVRSPQQQLQEEDEEGTLPTTEEESGRAMTREEEEAAEILRKNRERGGASSSSTGDGSPSHLTLRAAAATTSSSSAAFNLPSPPSRSPTADSDAVDYNSSSAPAGGRASAAGPPPHPHPAAAAASLTFAVRAINVMDPLRPSSNLCRGIGRTHQVRLQNALEQGLLLFTRSIELNRCGQMTALEVLRELFPSTLQHICQHRPHGGGCGAVEALNGSMRSLSCRCVPTTPFCHSEEEVLPVPALVLSTGLERGPAPPPPPPPGCVGASPPSSALPHSGSCEPTAATANCNTTAAAPSTMVAPLHLRSLSSLSDNNNNNISGTVALHSSSSQLQQQQQPLLSVASPSSSSVKSLDSSVYSAPPRQRQPHHHPQPQPFLTHVDQQPSAFYGTLAGHPSQGRPPPSGTALRPLPRPATASNSSSSSGQKDANLSQQPKAQTPSSHLQRSPPPQNAQQQQQGGGSGSAKQKSKKKNNNSNAQQQQQQQGRKDEPVPSKPYVYSETMFPSLSELTKV